MTLREARKMLEQLGFVQMDDKEWIHLDGRQLYLGNNTTVQGYPARKIKSWYNERSERGGT